MKGKPVNVLAIVSHPDDETLGCGGALIKHVTEGDNVYLCILSRGIASRGESDKEKDKKITKLMQDVDEVAKTIGVKEVIQCDFSDNQFDTIPLLDIIKSIEQIVDRISPDVIYTHYKDDLNVDHRITYEAVLTATRPIGNNKNISIFSFETLSSTEWQKKPFVPNRYIDISHFLEKKIEVFQKYQSEKRAYPHPRSAEGIKTLAMYRGMQAGVPYAEAFETVRLLVN